MAGGRRGGSLTDELWPRRLVALMSFKFPKPGADQIHRVKQQHRGPRFKIPRPLVLTTYAIQLAPVLTHVSRVAAALLVMRMCARVEAGHNQCSTAGVIGLDGRNGLHDRTMPDRGRRGKGRWLMDELGRVREQPKLLESHKRGPVSQMVPCAMAA